LGKIAVAEGRETRYLDSLGDIHFFKRALNGEKNYPAGLTSSVF
jgi:hypothetical protein